ncbi:uncharacterized protein LOC132751484 isoform X2 [Ruditapes philippinarum]|nr:uncharacterized protein LOC132751484 isoform X2 [Ruditapes philippinarum]
MSDEEVIKVASTVGTAPLWVPVAAAGGLVYGAGKGLDAANDFGKENGPLAGIAAALFIVGANIIAGPFRGIKKVGDVMIGKKKKKEWLEIPSMTIHYYIAFLYLYLILFN